MLRIILICLLAITSPALLAQTLQKVFGNDVVSVHNVSQVLIANPDGNIWYITEDDYGNQFMEKQALNENKMTELGKVYDASDKNNEVEKMFLQKNELHVLTKAYHKKAKTISFVLSVFDLQGKQVGAPKEVLLITLKKKQDEGSTVLTISPDFSHYMIYYRSHAADEITYYGFDSNWKQIVQHTAVLKKEFKDGYVEVGGFGITNDGTMHYVVEKDRKVKKKYSVSFTLYAISANAKDSVLLNPWGMGLGDYHVASDEGKIICMGVTGENARSSGLYFARYSLADKKLTEENSPFRREMFVTPGVEIPEDGSEPDFGMRYKISRITKTSTGGYYMLVETAFATMNQAPGGGTVLMLTFPNSHLVSFSNTGNVNWISTMFKQHMAIQRSAPIGAGFGGAAVSVGVRLRTDDFALYFAQLAVMDDVMYLIANDDPINTPQPTNQDNVQDVRKPDQLSGVLISIDANGKISKENLKNPQGEPISIYPTLSYGSRDVLMSLYYTDETSGVIMLKR